MCVVLELKNIFLSSYFGILLVHIFIKDGMSYGVVCNRESPSRITRKSSFYKVLANIYRHMYIHLCVVFIIA